MTFGVLGPLVAADEHGPVALRGPRHRAVLARLLIARRRVVPVRVLAEDLWPDPPEGAIGAIQTFVAALRQSLEPGRPRRAPATLLVTEPPGYALRAHPDSVDAWRFEASLSAPGALSLWRGPAYSEFAEEPWARTEIARLAELRLHALELRAEAALARGEAATVAADLRAHVTAHPWREHAWQLLALALYRSGRQGDALAALRTARAALVSELGVDPGPALRRLEADILAQSPELDGPRLAIGLTSAAANPASAHPAAAPPVLAAPEPTSASPAVTAPPVPAAPEPTSASPAVTAPPVPAAPQPTSAPPVPAAPQPTSAAPVPVVPQPTPAPPATAAPPLLARATELATLAATPPRLHLAVITGDPGSGKTALAEALTATLHARGWTTAWGRNPEHPDTPATWPWTQILSTLGVTPAPPPPDPAAARHHLHRTVLSTVDTHAPLLLVLDDLHRATEQTLAVLDTLLAEAPPRPILIATTLRPNEIPSAVTELLARAEPTRVHLAGLPLSATTALIHATTQRPVPDRIARAIHERSGGNPFFIRELARLHEAEGEQALTAVPAGVRDVLRHRLDILPTPARTVLRQAAVIGREADLDLLITLSGNENLVLDTVDSALLHGFLTEAAPDRLRFAHALVRDTLYEEVSAARRTRWHATLAHALETLRPQDVEALAHHHLLAGPHVPADRLAHHTAAAARLAEQRFAPREAARLWQAALDAHHGDPRTHLELLMGLVRAQAVTGNLETARHHRLAALTQAEALADPVLTARVLGAFDVPGIWTTNDDPALSARVVEVADRTLAALPPELTAHRARLLSTLAMELRGTHSAHATEAEALARELDDPSLLAHALNARFMHTFRRTGLAPERATLGRELLTLSRTHNLVSYEVLAHLILLQSHSALADFAAADEHADAADRLSHNHELPLVGVFTDWYAALRLSATGHRAEAETAYHAAATRLPTTGMTGLEPGLLPLALLSLDPTSSTVDLSRDWGPYLDWVRPLALLPTDRAAALAALRAVPDTPPDLLAEARLCLLAHAAIALGDKESMARAHRELAPAAGELAGAGSGLLTFGPVAAHLAALERALN